jgi:HAD superfamily hydrolase (TIGR01509 family)
MSKLLDQLNAAERKLGEFQAYLYDCDGTLADSMMPHKEAWVEEIQRHAPEISSPVIHALIDELAGMPGTKTVDVINQRYSKNLDSEALSNAKESLFFSDYIHRVTPIDFVVEHLKARAARGAKIGVVSGGRTKVVNHLLKVIQVADLVEVVICAEDVKFGKPHPEPFLMAAERLGVSAVQCLVLEDANMGIQSATAAGMKSIRIDQL